MNETGWLAHFEYVVSLDVTRVFLTHRGFNGRREFATVENGAIIMRTISDDEPIKPFIESLDAVGIVNALITAAQRANYVPDVERELRSELTAVKTARDSAHALGQQLLTHLLTIDARRGSPHHS